MSRPIVPLAPAVQAHGHHPGHDAGQHHGHAHGQHDGHGHGHPQADGQAAPAGQHLPPSLPPSLLMAGVGARLLGVAGLLLLLWAAVAWALGEPA